MQADTFWYLCLVPKVGTDPVLIQIFLKLTKKAQKTWNKSKIFTFTEVIKPHNPDRKFWKKFAFSSAGNLGP